MSEIDPIICPFWNLSSNGGFPYGTLLLITSGEVISEEYSLEYGTDTMEMHVGAVQPGDRALIVDDLIATGGTLCAAIKLLGIILWLYSSLIYMEMIFAGTFLSLSDLVEWKVGLYSNYFITCMRRFWSIFSASQSI